MKEARLHLRLDPDLLARVKVYSRRKKITLTSLVEQQLTKLLEEEERREFEAEQA